MVTLNFTVRRDVVVDLLAVLAFEFIPFITALVLLARNRESNALDLAAFLAVYSTAATAVGVWLYNFRQSFLVHLSNDGLGIWEGQRFRLVPWTEISGFESYARGFVVSTTLIQTDGASMTLPAPCAPTYHAARLRYDVSLGLLIAAQSAARTARAQ